MISRRDVLKLLGGGFFSAVGLSSYAFAVEPLFRLKTTFYQPRLNAWPKGLNLRIAALADLHACKPWMTVERIQSIVERTNQLQADIVLLLGDYSAGMSFVIDDVPASQWAPVLGGLKAKHGVYAVLGNHDWWEDPDAQRRGDGPTFGQIALEKEGIRVLENDVVQIIQGDHKFWIAGLGDQLAFPPFRKFGRRHWKTRDDLQGMLEKIEDDAPVILMAHEPDIFPKLPDRIALTLSGHTHGGQVRVFGYSPINTSGQRLNYGHVKEGRKHLIVSGGLGCSMLPVRFGSPPEIVVVDLA
ncbi:MAG: metallophosphoesterase [Pseudomonadota bacterium]